MKFALFENQKIEATKGAKGLCPSCGSELIAKCGEFKINHWSHKGNRNCDSWWENETDWHRSWKDKFSKEWQEVIHYAKNGEKHIADVKTTDDWVIEFQHSFLKPEERRARNAFYTKLVWIVDGSRRTRDFPNFIKVKNESTTLSMNPHIIKVYFPDECKLLTEWHDDKALVFFDFQEDNENLWFLFPSKSNDTVCLSYLLKSNFIELHSTLKFDVLVNNTIKPLSEAISRPPKRQQYNVVYYPPNRLLRKGNRRF